MGHAAFSQSFSRFGACVDPEDVIAVPAVVRTPKHTPPPPPAPPQKKTWVADDLVSIGQISTGTGTSCRSVWLASPRPRKRKAGLLKSTLRSWWVVSFRV